MKKKKLPKTASLVYEHFFMRAGYRRIVGIDEAGRGAWAGPVTAGAVCLPVHDNDLSERLAGVRDSKQLSPRQREGLVDTIKAVSLAWGIGNASSDEIDQYGIVPATKLAMKRALQHMTAQFDDFSPDYLLTDSMKWDECPVNCEIQHIKWGDQQSLSIAAASVLAKVWRDETMCTLAEKYPDYGFSRHKGYGTQQHRNALESYGALPIHRTYYRPIQAIIAGQ